MTEQQIIAALATVLFFSILINIALTFVVRKAMRAMDNARATLLKIQGWEERKEHPLYSLGEDSDDGGSSEGR